MEIERIPTPPPAAKKIDSSPEPSPRKSPRKSPAKAPETSKSHEKSTKSPEKSRSPEMASGSTGAKGQGHRRRVKKRKLVSKTSMNDEGYIGENCLREF